MERIIPSRSVSADLITEESSQQSMDSTELHCGPESSPYSKNTQLQASGLSTFHPTDAECFSIQLQLQLLQQVVNSLVSAKFGKISIRITSVVIQPTRRRCAMVCSTLMQQNRSQLLEITSLLQGLRSQHGFQLMPQ